MTQRDFPVKFLVMHEKTVTSALPGWFFDFCFRTKGSYKKNVYIGKKISFMSILKQKLCNSFNYPLAKSIMILLVVIEIVVSDSNTIN